MSVNGIGNGVPSGEPEAGGAAPGTGAIPPLWDDALRLVALDLARSLGPASEAHPSGTVEPVPNPTPDRRSELSWAPPSPAKDTSPSPRAAAGDRALSHGCEPAGPEPEGAVDTVAPAAPVIDRLDPAWWARSAGNGRTAGGLTGAPPGLRRGPDPRPRALAATGRWGEVPPALRVRLASAFLAVALAALALGVVAGRLSAGGW